MYKTNVSNHKETKTLTERDCMAETLGKGHPYIHRGQLTERGCMADNGISVSTVCMRARVRIFMTPGDPDRNRRPFKLLMK